MIRNDFIFSQSNLQDYRDCQKRFELKYIKQIAWPAIDMEPATEYEDHIEKGIMFHNMVHQHLSGVPADILSDMITDDELTVWWNNYLRKPPSMTGKIYPEIVLSTPADGFRLIAKYDLLCIDKNNITIIDWKTSGKKPEREWLQGRLQTRVYLYLAISSIPYLVKKNINPEEVKMLYWFAGFPEETEIFSYGTEKYEKDKTYISLLINEIKEKKEFNMTSDSRRCVYCIYRSFCRKGVKAGKKEDTDEIEADENFDINFEFDQIGEIEI
jgi:hypothetical protein